MTPGNGPGHNHDLPGNDVVVRFKLGGFSLPRDEDVARRQAEGAVLLDLIPATVHIPPCVHIPDHRVALGAVGLWINDPHSDPGSVDVTGLLLEIDPHPPTPTRFLVLLPSLALLHLLAKLSPNPNP